MNISALSPQSFLLETKTANISINNTLGDVSVFSAFQEGVEENTTLHWPGEYEVKGVSVFISPVQGDESVVKIFSEGIRIVIFSDEGWPEKYDEKILSYFENTDVLICLKKENGIPDNEYKKLIEKIDPRILITPEGHPEKVITSFSFPLQKISKLSITADKLPTNVSEYYTLTS